MYIRNKIQFIFSILICSVLLACTSNNIAKPSNTLNIAVDNAKITSIILSSENTVIPNGSTTKIVAIAKLDNHTEQDITNQVIWSISNSRALSIMNNGQVIAKKQGVIGISAMYHDITSNTASIVITPTNTITNQKTETRFN